MKNVLLIGFVVLSIMFSAVRADAWFIMYPISPMTYRTNDTVTGGGVALFPTAGNFMFRMLVIDAAGNLVPFTEGQVSVPALSIMGGAPPYLWAGIIPAPPGGWTPSPPIPGMPGMKVPDHYTEIQDMLFPVIPNVTGTITGPHTVL